MKLNFPPQGLGESIYATVCFFDVFDKPVHRREFTQYLLGVQASQDDVDGFLAKDKRLGRRDEYYFLPGREEVLAAREARAPVTDLYWKKVSKYVPKLHKIPFIKAIAVCNSLAFEHCNSESDIDLFIITKKNRIFLARVLSGILLHLYGVRRYKNKIAGRFCLSFYVAEDGMDLEEMVKENEVYLYYWMKSLEFVYRRDENIYRRFYKRNEWFRQQVPYGMGNMLASERTWFARSVCSLLEFVLSGWFGNVLESRFEKRHLERFEEQKQRLGEEADVVVNRKMLKFHNVDKRDEFNRTFFENYRRF